MIVSDGLAPPAVGNNDPWQIQRFGMSIVVPCHPLAEVHAPEPLGERQLDAPFAHERTLACDEIAATEVLPSSL
jgi:hypothetical protein